MSQFSVWRTAHPKTALVTALVVLGLIVGLVAWGGSTTTWWANLQELKKAKADAAIYQKQMADKDVQHAQELKDKAEQMQVLETQREASLAAARLALTSAAAAKAKAADAEQRVQTLAQQHDVLVGQLKLLSDALVAARDTSNVKDENVVPSIRTWLRARAAADGQRAGNAGAAAAPTAAGPVTAGPAVRPR